MTDQPQTPSSSVRTTINVLLMVHFVFIGVAMIANFRPSSSFWQRLQNIPFTTHYAQLLSQDITYNGPFSNFALAEGQYSSDYRCRVLLDWTDAVQNDPAAIAELQQIELMPEGTTPAIRRQRYLQLNKFVGWGDLDPASESLLPQAMVNYMLAKADLPEPERSVRHRFQCNARLLQDLQNLRSSDPGELDPRSARYLAPRYEADIVRTREGWALNKVAGREEVTQVQDAAGNPPANNSQGGQ